MLFKKHAVRIGMGGLVLLVFLLDAAHVVPMGFVARLEALSYDLRLNLTMPRTVDPRIVIVDIDEKSLAEEGRWPWSRIKLGKMLDNLFDRYQVAVAGFDVVYAERDESSGLNVLERLARKDLKGDERYQSVLSRLRPELDYDSLFAQKIKGRPVVLGYYFTGQGNVSGVLPPPVFPAGTFDGMDIPFATMTGYGANLPELQKNAAGAGYFSFLPDRDGVARRVSLLVEYRGAYYEALSLAMMRTLMGGVPLIAGFPEGPGGGAGYTLLEWLGAGDLRVPVDERVAALIPYRGQQGSFTYVSAADVLHNRVPRDVLEGKIVLVGTTAPGLMDLRATPVSSVFPGVEVHANLIAGMLDQNIKFMPAYVLAVELLTLLAAGLLLTLLLPLYSPFRASLVTLLVLGAIAASNFAAWQYGNLVLPLAAPVLMVLLIYILNMSYGFFVESRAKRQITGLFGQYVPPELVDEMSRDPEKFTMEGESREMTVLFSDVRGFTTISEGLKPKELSRLMNEYMTPMTRIIHKHRGTIDKYIGDAIMAFWGAPLADEEHARHAVLAALEMQSTLAELRPQFIARRSEERRVGKECRSRWSPYH
jgi:adenylate cyclase